MQKKGGLVSRIDDMLLRVEKSIKVVKGLKKITSPL